MTIENPLQGLRSRYSPVILLSIVLSSCLLLCCITFLILGLIGNSLPPSFEITQPSEIQISTSESSQTLKFDCMGIESIKINQTELSAPERGKACGNTDYKVDLVEGENTITIQAVDRDGNTYAHELVISYEVPTDNIAVEEPEQEEIPDVEQPEVQPYINANDFKNTTYEQIVAKYGEPETLYDNEPPVYNLFNYAKENYVVEGNYLKNDTRVSGAAFFLEDRTCSIYSFDFETASEILPLIQLDQYKSYEWETVNSYFKQYRLEDVDDWKSVAITCTDEGVFKATFYGK